MQAAEKDLEALRVRRGRLDELRGTHATLTANIKLAKAACDTLAALIRELKVSAAMCHLKVGFVVRDVSSTKGRITAGEDNAEENRD